MEPFIKNTSKQDQRMAETFIAGLNEIPQAGKKGTVIKIKLEDIELPPIPMNAFSLLVEIIKNMAAGKSNAVIPTDILLTTQQAAEILNISRPYLVKLLEKNAIPHTKAGTHRRLELKDVLEYKRKRKAITREQLAYLAKESQQINLY